MATQSSPGLRREFSIDIAALDWRRATIKRSQAGSARMVQMRSLPRSGSLSLPDACFRHHQLPQFKYIAENLSPLAHGSNVVDATISDAMGAGQISLLEIDNSMDGS